MNVVDIGSGCPLVVVPGIQGRWEWMRPGIMALAAHCRVLTFSLADEPSARSNFDKAVGFECYVDQIRAAMDEAGVADAVVCGVSYGALAAAVFAARHPHRVRALVLISPLPPSWTPDSRVRLYLRAPRLLAPLFWARAPVAAYAETTAAIPALGPRVRTSLSHLWRVITHPASPYRMARRARMLERTALAAEVSEVRTPTLILTGEAGLDRIVQPQLSAEYTRLIPGARAEQLPRTGHLGIVTRPAALADIVGRFVQEHAARRATPEQLHRRAG